jgi:hypothetical protein
MRDKRLVGSQVCRAKAGVGRKYVDVGNEWQVQGHRGADEYRGDRTGSTKIHVRVKEW